MENQKTQQDLVDRGVLAEELLKNETFGTAVKEVVDQQIMNWLNSNPIDPTIRENAFFAAQGINNVIGVLQQWVAIKEQIVAEQAANEEV